MPATPALAASKPGALLHDLKKSTPVWPACAALRSRKAAQEEVKRKAYQTLAGHDERMDRALKNSGGVWHLGKRFFSNARL